MGETDKEWAILKAYFLRKSLLCHPQASTPDSDAGGGSLVVVVIIIVGILVAGAVIGMWGAVCCVPLCVVSHPGAVFYFCAKKKGTAENYQKFQESTTI